MDKRNENVDPMDFLASLERRHEVVLREIDQLADRIEKTLLEYKSPNSATILEKTPSIDSSVV